MNKRNSRNMPSAAPVTQAAPVRRQARGGGLFNRDASSKQVIAVSVTQEEKDVIADLAERMGISMSALVLKALGEYVNKA